MAKQPDRKALAERCTTAARFNREEALRCRGLVEILRTGVATEKQIERIKNTEEDAKWHDRSAAFFDSLAAALHAEPEPEPKAEPQPEPSNRHDDYINPFRKDLKQALAALPDHACSGVTVKTLRSLVELCEKEAARHMRAPLPSQSEEWYTIDTAPLYENVLLYRDGDLAPVVGFRMNDNVYMLEEGGPEDGVHRHYPVLTYNPTHWRRLPLLPGDKAYNYVVRFPNLAKTFRPTVQRIRAKELLWQQVYERRPPGATGFYTMHNRLLYGWLKSSDKLPHNYVHFDSLLSVK